MPFVEPREIPGKPWGHEIVLVEWPGYQLKKLVYEAGHQGALQFHPVRHESFHLHEGVAEVTWYRDKEALTTRCFQRMVPGMTFHVPAGMPHKFHAITTCVVFEISNGAPPASVNVADQYGDADGQAR